MRMTRYSAQQFSSTKTIKRKTGVFSMKSLIRTSMLAMAVSLSAASFNVIAEEVDESKITTPAEAIAALKAGNERFTSGNVLNQDFKEQIAKTAGGQAPFATILSCLDSRIPPEIVFDLGIGDAFVGRVAGNIEDVNMLGSFEFATAAVGTKVVVVMGHTSCGAVIGACGGVELGNLTALLGEIEPAVEIVRTANPGGKICEAPLVDEVSRQNVLKTIADIRESSPVMAGLEADGKLKIVGAMYDISSGTVTWL
jgi:carbonic anhydrase